MNDSKLLEEIIIVVALIFFMIVATLERHTGNETASEQVILEEHPLVEVEPEDDTRLIELESENAVLKSEIARLEEEMAVIRKELDLFSEIDLLAHLIYAEAGSDWCTDRLQLRVGSVALNRVKHPDYPDNLYDVIHQSGQYSCVRSGMIDYEYNDRAYECAKFLILNGSQLPDNVVYQAEFTQGDGVYDTDDIKDGRVMYFCYKGEKDGR